MSMVFSIFQRHQDIGKPCDLTSFKLKNHFKGLLIAKAKIEPCKK